MNKTVNFSLILLFAIAITFISCDKESFPKCEDGSCENTLHPNSRLEITEDSIIQDIEIVSGSKLVFKHQFEKNQRANVADDEFWDWVYFEIDPDLNKFSYSDADLSEINAVYEYSCFCFGPFHGRISKGSISGTRKRDKWVVDVDIEVDMGNGLIFTKTFSNTFD